MPSARLRNASKTKAFSAADRTRARTEPAIAVGRWRVYASVQMSKTRSEVLDESRKKGIVAGAATAGAVVVGVLTGAATAGAVVAVPAVYLAYKWWRHRAENGIKF